MRACFELTGVSGVLDRRRGINVGNMGERRSANLTKEVSAWSGLGILTGFLYGFYAGLTAKLIFIACCVLCAVVLIAAEKRKYARVLSGGRCLAVLLCFAAAAALYSAVFTAVTVNKISEISGNRLTVTGVVTDITEGDVQQVTIRAHVAGVGTKLGVYLSGASVSCGDKITIEAVVSDITDASDRSYMYPKGFYANISSPELISVRKASGIALLYQAIKEYSHSISERLRQTGNTDSGELLSSMLCGDDPVLSDSLRTDLNRAGIGHLMAVSGLHVCTITAFVSFVMEKLRAGRYLKFIVCEGIMAAFIVFSGMSVSAIRAFIMMTLMLLSRILYREYSGISALATSVILITCSNPFAAADPSLLMSISGVFAANTVTGAVIRGFNLRQPILKALVLPISASICILPLSLLYFDEISIISPIANIIFVPISSMALCLCMLFALLGGQAVFAFLTETAGLLADIVVKGCRFLSEFRFTFLPVRFRVISLIVLSMSALVASYFLISGNLRRTVFASMGVYALAVCMIFTLSVVNKDKVYASLTVRDGEFLCVVGTLNSAIAIDSSCEFADTLSRFLAMEGTTVLDGVVVLENGVSGYPSYLRSETVPKALMFYDTKLAGNAYGTELIELVDGTVINAYGVGIIIHSNSAISVVSGGSELYIGKKCPQDPSSDDAEIVVVNGITVFSDSMGTFALDGDLERRWVLSDSFTFRKNEVLV